MGRGRATSGSRCLPAVPRTLQPQAVPPRPPPPPPALQMKTLYVDGEKRIGGADTHASCSACKALLADVCARGHGDSVITLLTSTASLRVSSPRLAAAVPHPPARHATNSASQTAGSLPAPICLSTLVAALPALCNLPLWCGPVYHLALPATDLCHCLPTLGLLLPNSSECPSSSPPLRAPCAACGRGAGAQPQIYTAMLRTRCIPLSICPPFVPCDDPCKPVLQRSGDQGWAAAELVPELAGTGAPSELVRPCSPQGWSGHALRRADQRWSAQDWAELPLNECSDQPCRCPDLASPRASARPRQRHRACPAPRCPRPPRAGRHPAGWRSGIP